MKTVTIKPDFSIKHKLYLERAQDATLSVAEGAVRSGKTIDNVYAFARELNNGTPDRIHLATGSTIANAKLNIGDCNGYGLEYIFRGRCKWGKYKDNEALMITLHGRTYVVIFAGAGKADSFKKIRGNSYGMWIATEVNLHHEDTIKEAFNRQLAAVNRRIFWDLNPSAPSSWIYTDYIDRFPEQFGAAYNYEHFVIQDNATITPERFEEIERQYVKGSIWYRRDILGERCSAEGLVYPMFSEDNIVDDHFADVPEDELRKLEAGKSASVGEWYMSMDYGTENPTAAGLWRIYNGTATMEYEYYYDGRKTQRQKTDEEYCQDLREFIGDIPVKRIIIDPSADSMKRALQKHGFHTQDAKNSVIDGIRFTASQIAKGKVKIHRSCENTIGEFGLYRWDDKQPEDTVIKENDHGMDAMRYLCYTLRNKFRYGGS